MAQNLTIYAKYVTAGSSSNQIYQDCLMAGSSSQDATETAYPTNQNRTNKGYTYLSSNPTASAVRFIRTRTESTDAAAFMTKYPTSGDLHTRGQYAYGYPSTTSNGNITTNVSEASAFATKYPTNTNRTNKGTTYTITGSMIIPAGVATFVSASFTNIGFASTLISASIATGSLVKVSIPVENFIGKNTRVVNEANDIKGYSILSYNGIVESLAGYNQFSSSIANGTTSSFAVIYASASRASMGRVVTSDLYLSLGTTQNSSTTVQRPIGLYVQYPFETNSGSAAYNAPLYNNGVLISSSKQANELRYPNNTSKAGWVGGVSPKNK
jgi:hypothetical protein